MSIKHKVTLLTSILVIGASVANAKGPGDFLASKHCFDYARGVCGFEPKEKAARNYWDQCMETYIRQCGPMERDVPSVPMTIDPRWDEGSGSDTNPRVPSIKYVWEIDPSKTHGSTTVQPADPKPGKTKSYTFDKRRVGTFNRK